MTSRSSPRPGRWAFRRWLHAAFSQEAGVTSFDCHPWPNTYLTWTLTASVALALGSFGIFELRAGAWSLGSFLLVGGISLLVLGLLTRDQLRLDGEAITRPSGRATRRILFEAIVSFDASDRGDLTITYRGTSWLGGKAALRRERARMRDVSNFLQEAFAQIETRCGTEFVSDLRARSNA